MMQRLKLLAKSWVPGDTWCSACACDYTVCVAYMISLPSLPSLPFLSFVRLYVSIRMSLGFAFTSAVLHEVLEGLRPGGFKQVLYGAGKGTWQCMG